MRGADVSTATTAPTIAREAYRIGTDTMPNGKTRARARGTKSNTLTTAYDSAGAAAALARKIEGDRFDRVERVSHGAGRNGLPSADFVVYVTA